MTETEAKTLAAAFKKRFGGRVEYEEVDAKGRYRFAVRSKKFDGVPHMKRQDEMWSVIDEVLARDSTLDLASVLAYSPADLAAYR